MAEIWTVKPGQLIRTRYGIVMIDAISTARDQYLVTNLTTKTTSWLDISTVLPEEYLGASLSDPEIAERFLNDEPIVDNMEPSTTVEAEAIECTCGCGWCYKISWNGFHSRNPGACKCIERKCACL